MSSLPDTVIAFNGWRSLGAGAPGLIAGRVRAELDTDPSARVLIFDLATGKEIDFNLRGTPAEVQARIGAVTMPAETPIAPRGPGRPKLGVVAREVTLLPRHWDWLAQQPGGASVALRKLVDEARRGETGKLNARAMQERAYRFMSAIGGDLPGFEEASRALFANDRSRFEAQIVSWPDDVRACAIRMAFDPGLAEPSA